MSYTGIFASLGGTPGTSIRYDRNTKEFEDVFQRGPRIGDCIYTGLATDTLICYDLSSSEEKIISTDYSSIKKLSVRNVDGYRHLLVQDEIGAHLLKDNQELL